MADLIKVAKQIERLKSRFGDRAFDPEFIDLARGEMARMRDDALIKMVDFFIGSRPANRPPLISDFRDGRYAAEKVSFNADVAGALKALDKPWQTGLKPYLENNFPGCKTLEEAVEVRRLQIQIAKANDQTYDPMQDPTWV